MKRKGFTIVELIGVIVILGIVLGLVSLAYVNINNHTKLAYYQSLEESVMISAGDYFSNNEGEQPKIFEDTTEVEIGVLTENKYITEVNDRDGNPCGGYVGAYKNSYDKTNYFVCLECNDDYVSDNKGCKGEVDYSLRMTPYENDSKNIYQDGSWVKGYVNLSFKTFNDVKTINVENESGNVVKTCELKTGSDGVNSCSLKIDVSGKYKVYGIGESGKNTGADVIEIKIDNTKPSFNIYNETNNNINDKTIEYEYQNSNINIKDYVRDIEDKESGIKRIEYSFEKEISEEKYQDVDKNKTNFEVLKELGLGQYKLVVRITDNVGNVTSKSVIYNVYRDITKLSASLNPTSYTYDGTEKKPTVTVKDGSKTLVKDTDYTVSYKNNINAGEATAVITGIGNYKNSINKTFTITVRNITITASNQTITYGQEITKTTSKVSVGGDGLASGHSIAEITLTPSTTDVTTTGTITPSAATIKSGTTNVTDNYSITYQTGTLIIKAKSITIPTASAYCNALTYNGSEQTLTKTAGEGYTFSDNKGTNAGEYTVKATLKNNYAWSDGTSGEKTFKCTISKKTLTPTVTVSNKTYDGGTSATGNVTLAGAVANQTPSATASCTFNNANVGTAKPVSCTITLGSSWTTNYQLSTTSASKTANITSKTLTITASNQTVTYGIGITKSTDKITANGLISGHSVTVITLTQSTTNVTTTGKITPSAATIKSGTTDVTNNYSITYNTGTLTINKANAVCPTMEGYTGTYDGNPHPITVSGGSGGKIWYSVDNTNWQETMPTRTSAGYGDVYVKVVGDDNHNTVECGYRRITLNKADAICPTMEGYTGTYDGNPHPITVSGGSGGKILYSVDNTNWKETMPTRTSAGYGDVYIKVVGDDNHNTVECGYRRITLEKKAVTITANAQTVDYGKAITEATDKVTANGLVSGHNITEITLTQSTTNVTTTGTITPSAATIKSGTTDVTSNYNITYNPGTLTINAAAPTITISMEGEKYKDGYKSPATATLTCSSSDGISSFTTTPKGTSVSNSQIDVKFTTAGIDRSVTGTCTSTSGLTTTKKFTYKIYKNSAHKDCGFDHYEYPYTCTCYNDSGSIHKSYDCNYTIYNDYSGSCALYCAAKGYNEEKSQGICNEQNTVYNVCWHT